MTTIQLTSDARDRLLKWALIDGHDVPSLTMAQAAIGLTPGELRTGYFAAPRSLGAFGRCNELVQAVPELRQAFPLIEAACPEFGPVLDAWDELVGLFVSDREACYARLRDLTTAESLGTWEQP